MEIYSRNSIAKHNTDINTFGNSLFQYTPIIGLITVPFLRAFLPNSVISILAIILIAIGGIGKNGILLYPATIFFYSQYGAFAGVSVYRLYSLIIILRFFSEAKGRLAILKRVTLPFAVMLIYCLYFAFAYNVRTGLFSIVDIICCVLVATYIVRDNNVMKKFFEVYTVVALAAFLYGILFQSSMSTMWNFSGSIVKLTRLLSTFEDPNYMGFFYTIAVFSVFTLELFKKKIRIIILCLLYGIIISSLSISAILINIILWIVYFMISGKFSIKSSVLFLIGIAALVLAYQYGLSHRSASVLGGLSYRIEEKIGAFITKDYGITTTNRINLLMNHLEYFMEQSFFKQLFGFNLSNVYVFNLGEYSYSAHNEYVDMLLDVGIIGTTIMISSLIVRIYTLIKEYRNGSKISISILMMKLIWVAYAFSLTLFLDFRFMVFFFV